MSSAAAKTRPTSLTGRFGRELHVPESDGDAPDWGIYLFYPEDGEDPVRVSGVLPEADLAARRVTVDGHWTETEIGPLFRVDDCWRGLSPDTPPPTPEAVEAFAAEFFEGLHFGPASAERLVEDCAEAGLDPWTVLARRPNKLGEFVGDAEKARAMHERMLGEGLTRATHIAKLMGIGLSLAYARRVLNAMGDRAVERLETDPYAMTTVNGIGFATADRMVRNGYGMAATDPRRLKALARSVLTDAADDGHTSLPRGEALSRIEDRDDVADSDLGAEEILELAVEDGALVGDSGDVYLPNLLDAERRAAAGLVELQARESRSLPEDFWEDERLEVFDREQREAIALGVSAPVVLISGRPGTGKTTVARAIAQLAREQGVDVTLAATTGKAADRLTEAMRADDGPGAAVKELDEARTIHSLVGFGREEEKQLPSGVVLIDEVSMMDLPLLARTVEAARTTTSLVLLGDPNQLPSVLAGAVAPDIENSGIVNSVQLETVYRQDRNTLVAINAERTLRGDWPLFHGQRLYDSTMRQVNDWFGGEPLERKDIIENAFHLSPGDREEAPGRVLKVVQRLGERDYDRRRDIQVYTPMHKGRLGTRSLNPMLQEEVNPEGEPLEHTDKRGLELRIGDPVLQTRNDPDDRKIVNGMRGLIEEKTEDGGAVVRFENDGDRRVPYRPRQIGELALAYATTIHKGQGQQQPVSILVLHHSEHFPMLNRSLLYVASTRPEDMFVCIATKKALSMALNREAHDERHTRLDDRIRMHARTLKSEGSQPELDLKSETDAAL